MATRPRSLAVTKIIKISESPDISAITIFMELSMQCLIRFLTCIAKKKRSKLLLFGVSRLGILIVLGLNLEVCLWVCADWAEFWCLLAYHNVAAV